MSIKLQYKPLQDLAADEESCCQIFEFIAGVDVDFGCVKNVSEYGFMILWEYKPSYYDDAEPLHHIYIHYNGSISWMKGEMVINDFNVFGLVDLIRNLGYSTLDTQL